MALWRCTQMERRCRRKFLSRWYPETDEMRRLNSERNSAPSAFTGQDFRRQWGQTHGLQATMHIWQSCEQQLAQLQNLPRLLSATSMMQHKCGPLWHTMYLPADQGMSVTPSGRLPSVRRRPDGSFMLRTSALCSVCQMISFMAWWFYFIMLRWPLWFTVPPALLA